MLYLKNEFEKELFDISVANFVKRYDPERKMVKGWRGANGYHSRLVNCEVHEIRASFGAMLDNTIIQYPDGSRKSLKKDK